VRVGGEDFLFDRQLTGHRLQDVEHRLARQVRRFDQL
jgi:hypothetical protein